MTEKFLESLSQASWRSLFELLSFSQKRCQKESLGLFSEAAAVWLRIWCNRYKREILVHWRKYLTLPAMNQVLWFCYTQTSSRVGVLHLQCCSEAMLMLERSSLRMSQVIILCFLCVTASVLNFLQSKRKMFYQCHHNNIS